MGKTRRFLAMLLIVCMLLPIAVISPTSAAAPTKMSVADLAAASGSVATQIQTAIAAAPTNGGVRYDIVVPSTITVGAYSMGVEDYTLMAAQAICAINEGNPSSIYIAYKDVTLTGDYANGVNISEVDKGMILDLAVRTMKYGVTLGQLPTSFSRPVGSTTYDGRICIYSVAYIFAQTLGAYSTNAALPVSVSFSPTSYTKNDTAAPGETTAPTTPSVSEGETTEATQSTQPTQATTAAPTADWYAPVAKAAYELKQYVEKNKNLPASVSVNGNDATMSEMLYLCCQAIVNINSGTTSGLLDFLDLNEPENPQDAISEGNIDKAEYVERAQKVINFCKEYDQGPNYMTTSLGLMHYKEGVYFFAKIMSYYHEHKELPNYSSVTAWAITAGLFVDGDATFGNNYSSYAKYLVPTANCQSNNSTIITVAKTGMNYSSGTYGGYANPTSTYQAIFNLFEYLNDKTSYEYYYDTSRGALGVWRDKCGNCCDMAHLMIACSRSLGVPGRYAHGYCHFSSMSTGHVWATIYCGSQWYTADLVSNYNYLGYKTNRTGTLYNYYATLPF
ncbi:MAG: transglutaminase domain-containing protein [Ruminococcaceae bacterium]|nr:transglutaminase domain-containing protein [Oscillospiraceae bacterium]